MTLNVLKWVYNLGVRNERERIATHLQSIQAQHGVGMYGRPRIVEPNEDEKRKKDRLQFQAAVSAEINYIIEDIFRGNVRETESIMYPTNHKE